MSPHTKGSAAALEGAPRFADASPGSQLAAHRAVERERLLRLHVPPARAEAAAALRRLLPLLESPHLKADAVVEAADEAYLAVGLLIALLKRSSR